MCILLNFPSRNDPRPEPPAPSICMPRPVEPASTNAVSVHVLPLSSEPPSALSLPALSVARYRIAEHSLASKIGTSATYRTCMTDWEWHPQAVPSSASQPSLQMTAL